MNILLTGLLAVATIVFAVAVLGKRPRIMILGWLSAGLILSLFFLMVGFELLGALNAFFVVASATLLHLFSSLYGTKKITDAEREVTRGDWIHAIGSFAVLGSVLAFGVSETPLSRELNPELGASTFVLSFLKDFPEMSGVLGFVLFLLIVVSAVIGRPAWVRPRSHAEGRRP
jgi:hypothetical protein